MLKLNDRMRAGLWLPTGNMSFPTAMTERVAANKKAAGIKATQAEAAMPNPKL
jgi:hypothetical protein